MAHTTFIENYTFINNAGTVIIRNNENNTEITVQLIDLLEFIGQQLRSNKVREIESLSGIEYIKRIEQSNII